MPKIEITQLKEGITEFLRSEILAPGVKITSDTKLAEIGIDSVSIIELVLFVDRQFGIHLPDSLLTPENLESIQTLAQCVQGQA